jgi:hypothetical protein
LAAGLLKSQDFGVFYAIIGVGAGAQSPSSLVDNNRPNVRIGRGQPDSGARQFQGLSEKSFVSRHISH